MVPLLIGEKMESHNCILPVTKDHTATHNIVLILKRFHSLVP